MDSNLENLYKRYEQYLQKGKVNALAFANQKQRAAIEERYTLMPPEEFEIFISKMNAREKADFEEVVNRKS